KAEVVILTRRFALELGQHGITVNTVAPGFVRTDMTQRGRGSADWPGTEERFAARAMMGRIGEPEDIANAVVFLASPESGWITAQVLTVDGGRIDYIGHGLDRALAAKGRRSLVSRFRSSHHCAAASFATSESKDTSNSLIWCGFGSEVRISDSLRE